MVGEEEHGQAVDDFGALKGMMGAGCRCWTVYLTEQMLCLCLISWAVVGHAVGPVHNGFVVVAELERVVAVELGCVAAVELECVAELEFDGALEVYCVQK